MKINKCSMCGSEDLRIYLARGADDQCHASITCAKCGNAAYGFFGAMPLDALITAIDYWNNYNPEKPAEPEYVTLQEYLDSHDGEISYNGSFTYIKKIIGFSTREYTLSMLTDGQCRYQESSGAYNSFIFPSYEKAKEFVKSKIGEVDK